MNVDLETIRRIRAKTLQLLNSHDGKEWKESVGELHAQFNEIPTWILVYDDSDLSQCHEIFTEIVKPFFEKSSGYNFTVKYVMILGENQIFLDFLANNQEILEACLHSDKIGSMPIRDERSERDTFRSTNSAR